MSDNSALANNDINDQDISIKHKTIVSKDYEKKMRSLLLNKSKNTLSTEDLRNILLEKKEQKHEEDDDDFIEESQNEPMPIAELANNISSKPTSHPNTNHIANKNNDEYLQYLADYYTKDVTSQDKDVIGGHMLRKRNVNQLHIYELDRLNYEKITAKMADARYEESDRGEDVDTDESLYSDQSISNLEDDAYDDPDLHDDLFPLDLFDEGDFVKRPLTAEFDFETSEELETSVVEFSSDDEDDDDEDDGDILPTNKRPQPVITSPVKKVKKTYVPLYKVPKRTHWGNLKKSKDTTKHENLSKPIKIEESSSDSDDGFDDFLKDFQKSVKISTKLKTVNKQKLLSAYKKPTKKRSLSNKGVKKSSDNEDIKPIRKYKKRAPITMDSFFQAHLEVNAADYESYVEKDDIEEVADREDDVIEMQKNVLAKDDVASYFTKRHKDMSKQKSQIRLKASDVFKRLMEFSDNKNVESITNDFMITPEHLADIKKTLLSATSNFDYTIFLNYLNTSTTIDVAAITSFFDDIAIVARQNLVSLGNEKKNDEMISVFYKTICIPLLGFLCLINNTYLELSKKDNLLKMGSFIVRSLNNLFKVQTTYSDAPEYCDLFTKQLLTKTLSHHPNEYKKIVQYYNDKGSIFKKYLYTTLFLDLRIAVDIDSCFTILNEIDDLNIQKIFLGTCYLSYKKNEVTKAQLLQCLEKFTEGLYEESTSDYKGDNNFIFSLRSSYRFDATLANNNVTMILFRILIKYKSFFTVDEHTNAELLKYFKPEYKGKEDTFTTRLQKINMCSVLCCLNVNNFMLIISDFLKLLNTKELEKYQLLTYYKKSNIRNEILKDAFNKCLELHNSMPAFANIQKWQVEFYKGIGDTLWEAFYKLEWNLLGEKLVNKYSIELFVSFIKKLYFKNKSGMIDPIKDVLTKSIDVDDSVSLIYQFCMKTVLEDTAVTPAFIKTTVFKKLFMFLKVCDSVNTYSKVIEKTQKIMNNEILDYRGYKTFFKKSSDDIAPIDYYYSLSAIKITPGSLITTGLKIKVFTFIKYIIGKWITEVSYFKQKDSEVRYDKSHSDKFIEIIKNYILIDKNMMLMTSTVKETVKEFFIECNFNDFVELTNEIKSLNGDQVSAQLQTLFNEIDLPYIKSSFSYFVEVLIKHNVKDKKYVLKGYLNGIKTSTNLSKYINEICHNEMGFGSLIAYLLKHEIHTFSLVYRTLKIPKAILRAEDMLVTFLEGKCLNLTIDQWEAITELPSNHSRFVVYRSRLVHLTNKTHTQHICI